MQQRFHANRYNSMKIGLRGLLFTVNPLHEPKAFRELASLMEKVLAEYPEEYFAPIKVAVNNNDNTAEHNGDQEQNQNENENEANHSSVEKKNNNHDDDADQGEGEAVDDDDEENKAMNDECDQRPPTGGGCGTFADELKAELEGLNNNRNRNHQDGANTTDVDTANNDGNPGHKQHQQQRIRKPKAPRRFRMIDTNCKGYIFAAINFNEEFEAADRFAEQQRQQQENPNQIFNFCVGEAAALILDIGKRIVDTIVTSDVPLLRFTYYLYPCVSTAAPTVHAAAVLAEATKHHVQIPRGKSAARIETHFTVKNNSGVSNHAVLDEIKKGFQERLPLSKYLVMNQSGGVYRRQRQADDQQQQPKRVVNAAVSFIVLHSAALLCLQIDFTDKKEYALHKMGASFAESLN